MSTVPSVPDDTRRKHEFEDDENEEKPLSEGPPLDQDILDEEEEHARLLNTEGSRRKSLRPLGGRKDGSSSGKRGRGHDRRGHDETRELIHKMEEGAPDSDSGGSRNSSESDQRRLGIMRAQERVGNSYHHILST